MAQTVIEAGDSRTLTTSGGRYTGTAIFHVYDDAAPIETAADIVYGSNGMPALGDAFFGDPTLTASSFTAEILPDSRNVWRVTWNYTSGGGGGETVPPPQVGYLQVSMEYSGVFKDMYRVGDSGYSLDYQFGNPSGKDIGGKPIDAAGIPTSVFIPQHRLIVEETVAASELVSRTSLSRLAVATRNTSGFYGAASGTLLYEGCSARRVSATAYTLTHKFMYDEWYHMGQQPRMNSQREPKLVMGRFPYAEFVRWIQPFPRKTNFNAISDNF